MWPGYPTLKPSAVTCTQTSQENIAKSGNRVRAGWPFVLISFLLFSAKQSICISHNICPLSLCWHTGPNCMFHLWLNQLLSPENPCHPQNQLPSARCWVVSITALHLLSQCGRTLEQLDQEKKKNNKKKRSAGESTLLQSLTHHPAGSSADYECVPHAAH